MITPCCYAYTGYMENELNEIESQIPPLREENKRLKRLLIGTICLAVASIVYMYFHFTNNDRTIRMNNTIQEKSIVQNEFVTASLPPTTVVPTKTTLKNLTYALPQGWMTVKDATGKLQIGYDPNRDKPCGSTTDLDIGVCMKTSYGYGSHLSVRIYDYDGGSRHAFLYNHMSVPQKQDYLDDYNETEFMWNGNNCLFLNGIQISQSPTVWGMCALGNNQALFFVTFDREPEVYEQILKTITYTP